MINQLGCIILCIRSRMRALMEYERHYVIFNNGMNGYGVIKDL